MISIRQMYQLQELDWDIDARSATLITVEERLGDDQELQELRRQIEELEPQLPALRAQQREYEQEGERHRHKATEVEARLYGGSVRNPRELSDLQEELRQLRARQQPAEDTALNLIEQGDNLDAQLQDLKTRLSERTVQWEAEQASLKTQQAALTKGLSGLGRQRKTLAADLDATTRSLYDLLRQSRHGHAVAKVERGMCLGCRVSLPSHEIQRARVARELVQCTSCSRILYVS